MNKLQGAASYLAAWAEANPDCRYPLMVDPVELARLFADDSKALPAVLKQAAERLCRLGISPECQTAAIAIHVVGRSAATEPHNKCAGCNCLCHRQQTLLVSKN